MILTTELLADLRKKAEAACDSAQQDQSITDNGNERDAASGGYEALGRGALYGAPVVLSLLDRIAEQDQRWRATWCTAFGRIVSADSPRDCVTLGEPDKCEACIVWEKEQAK